jgi:hypothetical protein
MAYFYYCGRILNNLRTPDSKKLKFLCLSALFKRPHPALPKGEGINLGFPPRKGGNKPWVSSPKGREISENSLLFGEGGVVVLRFHTQRL